MDTPTSQQLSSETLTALSNLVTLQNTELIAQNSSLVITKNQISIINKENTTASFQFFVKAIQS